MNTPRAAGLLTLALLTSAAHAQWGTVQVATGLRRPVYVTAPRGDTSRIFVIEQRTNTAPAANAPGQIRIVNIPANTLRTTPFLTINNLATDSEQGLLGLAFHPNYNDANNGYFWVNYTRASDGATVIARYRRSAADPNLADPASATTVLTIAQPQTNHNGGWMAFGPDGYLYVATGDGGNGNDTGPGHTANTGNAQDTTDNLLGKLLRIDVDGADNLPGNADDDAFPADANRLYTVPASNPFVNETGDDEIWAYGLRNPWRNSFDRVTGDLWTADVGQGAWEEVNVSLGNQPELNYGWRCMEGLVCTNLSGCACNDPALVLPEVVYPHDGVLIGPPTNIAGCSITGGYVYRGNDIPTMQGRYFFADYCSGDILSFRYVNGEPTDFINHRTPFDPPGTSTIDNVTSFGEDARGELYITDQTGGQVFKVVCTAPGGCANPCPSVDFNQDGGIDVADIAAFFDAFTGVDPDPAVDPDLNQDGGIDVADIDLFFTAFAGGPC